MQVKIITNDLAQHLELVQVLYVNGFTIAILVDNKTGEFITKELVDIRKVISPEANSATEGEKHGSIRVDAPVGRSPNNDGGNGRAARTFKRGQR